MALDGRVLIYALTSFLLPRSTARNYALLCILYDSTCCADDLGMPVLCQRASCNTPCYTPPLRRPLGHACTLPSTKAYSAAPLHAAQQQQPASGDAIRQALQAEEVTMEEEVEVSRRLL